jgi:hypothetical protein
MSSVLYGKRSGSNGISRRTLKNLPCAERGFSFFRNRAAAAEAGKHPVHPQSSTAEPGAGCWEQGAGLHWRSRATIGDLNMAGVIKAAIVFALSNYSLTFLVVGLLFSIFAIARARNPLGQAVVVEKLLAWHVFWAIGVGYLYNFVMHAFFGQMSAAFIGWADSPFQFEVATASLGFAVVGFLAAFRSLDLRLAAIVGPSFFMLGGAAGHVYQMVTENNFAPPCGCHFLHGHYHPRCSDLCCFGCSIAVVQAPKRPNSRVAT